MSGKKRGRPWTSPDSLSSLVGVMRSTLRQSRQSHNQRQLQPLDVAQQIQDENNGRHRESRENPSPFKTTRDKDIASNENQSEQQKSPIVDLCNPDNDFCDPDSDAATETSTTAVKSPTSMTPNRERSSATAKKATRGRSRSSDRPPYHPSFQPSSCDRSEKKNQNSSSKRKSGGLQIDEKSNNKNTKFSKSKQTQKRSMDSRERHEEEFRNEDSNLTRWAEPITVPALKATVVIGKKKNLPKMSKKFTQDVKDMGNDCNDKSDDEKPSAWVSRMKGVVEAAETPSRVVTNGLNLKKANNKKAQKRQRKPGQRITPGASIARANRLREQEQEQPWRSVEHQDEYHTRKKTEKDDGTNWNPVSGGYGNDRISHKKPFGKRSLDNLVASPPTPDSFADSPAPRRSKRKKSLTKTNNVIEICSSESEDDNIVVTESDPAIADEEECDVTKFQLRRLAIGEKVYNDIDHRPRIIFNDAELLMDILYHNKANSFGNDPERISISMADIEDFAYWGKENAVIKPDGLLSFIYMKSDVITKNIERRNRRNSNNKTIVLEFEEEHQMNDIVELVADNFKAAAIPPDDIEVNAAVLIKDSKKPRSKSRSRKKIDEFLFGRKSDDILLVYPFEGDRNSIDAAADNLLELGYRESSEETEDLVGVEADIKPSPSVLSTAAENTSSENALTTTQNGQRTHFIEIRVEDYERLDTGEWLNDSLVDMWMQWISRHISCKQSSNVHFFTSHFYSTLAAEGAEGVRSWTAKKNINIFEKRFIFIPINKTLHWSLCIVVNPGAIVQEVDDEDPPLPCILFFDSLKMHGKRKIQSNVVKWLKAEWKRTKEGNADQLFTNGNFKLYDPQVPRQNNGSDCGVFVCRYALAMFQLRHKRFTRREAGLEPLGDEPSTPRSQRRSQSRAFEELITNGHAFDFDVEDIQRIRQEFKTLIQNLQPLYDAVKKNRIKAEEDKKRARRRQRAEPTRALEHERSLQERDDDASKSSFEKALTSNGQARNEISDSSSKENCIPSNKAQDYLEQTIQKSESEDLKLIEL